MSGLLTRIRVIDLAAVVSGPEDWSSPTMISYEDRVLYCRQSDRGRITVVGQSQSAHSACSRK